MRITTQYVSQLQRQYWQMNNNARLEAMTRTVSGQRLLRWSDDPATARAIDALVRATEETNGYREVIASVDAELQRAETGLSGLQRLLDTVRSQLTAAMDEGSNAGTADAKAKALKALRDELLSATNVTDLQGHAIFGGTTSGSEAVAYDGKAEPGARYAYVGNDGRRQVAIGPSDIVEIGHSVSEMAAMLNELDVAVDALERVHAGTIEFEQARQRVQDALKTTVATSDALGARIAGVGHQRNTLEAASDRHQKLGLSWQTEALRIGADDAVATWEAVSQYQYALDLLAKLGGRMQGPSIFDYL